ncbi:hypothetical protein C2E23DRAFT_885118 [Lenzites betulinus]|nr:hypothetical protein C2E23DRAFT_885118 [Lenzites betulinus]
MTGTRDAQTIDAHMARYSRELAAYTLRQWDLVRQSAEGGNNAREKSSTPPSSHQESTSHPNDDPRSTPGIHARDYARSLHRQTSGRAVAGNA